MKELKSMHGTPDFKPEIYQKQVDKITRLVEEINQINQSIYGLHHDFRQDGYLAYGEHLKSLMNVTNPFDYVKLNQKFMRESSGRFQRLMNKRYSLLKDLSQKLSDKDSIMFLFPEQIQEEINQFRKNGKSEVINPEVWAKFTNMLLGR